MEYITNRQKEFESISDIKLTKNLPLIIRCNGRGFSKLTRKYNGLYSKQLSKILYNAMFNSIKEFDGAVFGYQQSDEISFVLMNDQKISTDPWFGNRLQKIVSVSASTITYHVTMLAAAADIQFVGPLIFDSKAFIVPNINEAINNIISRQKLCLRNAITKAVEFEIRNKYEDSSPSAYLKSKSFKDKLNLLHDEFNISFHDEYDPEFRFGIATYKVPKIGSQRAKWAIDVNVPDYSSHKDLLFNIIKFGQDIIREGRVLLT